MGTRGKSSAGGTNRWRLRAVRGLAQDVGLSGHEGQKGSTRVGAGKVRRQVHGHTDVMSQLQDFWWVKAEELPVATHTS